MNKSELAAQISARCGLSKKDAELALGAMCDIIGETVAHGQRVQLTGFGTFEVRSRAARTGRNPKTGEAVEIPATRAAVFKPGKALKDAVEA